MSFAKLDSSITESSLWSEDLHVRIVFLTFLARKDETGYVSGARSGLIRMCNVTAEQFDNAIEKLSSPDSESKTPDFEGRRIAKIDGGYVVLNADKYRLPEETKKENHRLYMQKWREEKESVKSREITENHNHSPSVSVSESISEKEIEEIYLMYPTTDKNRDNQSTGKTSKNKQRIKKILESKYPLKKAIEFYLSECNRTKCYLKNFGTFLNNLPDVELLEDKKEETEQTLPQVTQEQLDIMDEIFGRKK